MHSSQQLDHSYRKNNQTNRRLFKYQTNLKSNKDHSQLIKQMNQNKLSTSNSGLYVPGKINFHQLLSLPLQEQIKRQNSIKENQTFFLKFQPDQSKKTQRSLKSHGQKLKKHQKIIGLTDKRSNIISQKSERVNMGNQIKQEQFVLKEAAKTVYFKPLGKITKNSTSQCMDNKGSQFERNRHTYRNNEDNPVQIVSYSYRDKLLMLLQIRRQQQSQRKNQNVRSSFSKYGNKTQRQFYSRSKMYEKSNQGDQKSARGQKNGNSLMRFRSNYHRRMKKEEMNMNNQQPSPWQLVDHVEDF